MFIKCFNYLVFLNICNSLASFSPLTSCVNQVNLRNTGDLLSKTMRVGENYVGGLIAPHASTLELNAEVRQSWYQRPNIYKKGFFSSGIGALQKINLGENIGLYMGVRFNHYHRQNPRPNYLVGTQWEWGTHTIFHARYRTKFKMPSFYDLYFKSTHFLNNPKLCPEEIHTKEIGVQHCFKDTSSVLYINAFWNSIKNLIFGTKVGVKRKAINRTEATSISGIKATLNLKWGPQWVFIPSYTYSYYQLNTGFIPEFPRHKSAITVQYRPSKEWLFALQNIYIGKRQSAGHVLKPYTSLRTDIEYSPKPSLKIFARMDNIFNNRYSPVYGYRHKGRAFYIGTSFRF